jgi:hypothetical protein
MKIHGEDLIRRIDAGGYMVAPACHRDRTLNDITGFLGKRENRDFNVAFPGQTGAHHPLTVMDEWVVCCQR